MFDTHVHLNLAPLLDNLDNTVTSARESGVEYFLVPGVDLESSKKSVQIANIFQNTYAAVGVHPTQDLEKVSLEKYILNLEELAVDPKVVAIGEIGLDYYHFNTGSVTQREFFKAQIKLAIKINKPIVIHTRHASSDTLSVLSEFSNSLPQLVFHCCEPDTQLLDFASKFKMYIGVDGDVTYDKDKQEFISRVPLEMLLLETDSPYLTPEPVRSIKRFPNEPANLIHIANKVSEIKKVSVEKTISATTANAKNIFRFS